MDLKVMEALHKHIMSLGLLEYTIATKNLVIGYKPFTYYGKPLPKFATLHGGKKYRCLVLHLNPGNPNSSEGNEIQKHVQEMLQFNIDEMRKLNRKNQEVYIPFEVIDTKEKLEFVKNLLEQLYINVSKR